MIMYLANADNIGNSGVHHRQPNQTHCVDIWKPNLNSLLWLKTRAILWLILVLKTYQTQGRIRTKKSEEARDHWNNNQSKP